MQTFKQLSGTRHERSGTCLRWMGLVLPFLCCACSGPQNYMVGAGPAAKGLAALGWFVLLVFAATSIVVWVLLAWIGLRRRGTLDWHAPIESTDGQRWILIGGIAIPVAVLAIVFIATLRSMTAFPMAHASASSAPIQIVGRQWWFNAQYRLAGSNTIVNSPSEVHIPAGQPIDLALQTRDVIHSFWVPKLHGKVDLVPGQTNHIRIQADRPGRYSGQCSEFCGTQHANMRLAVIAHAPAEYDRWLQRQSEPAARATSDEARRGAQVFMSSPCPACHTVRGTPARGTIGPELTHLASREYIAGGMLENNRANLQAWVTQAQTLKPGSQMPNITEFTGTELQALVTYLQGLH